VGETRRELATRAWSALLRSHAALVPEVDRSLQQAVGLPLGWYDVLLELAAAPERRLRMSDLGQRVVLSRTRVSRIVDELVAAGLVCRQDNPADRRSAYASLTEAGLARFRDAAPHYLSAIEDQFAARLTIADLRCISTALERALPPTPVTFDRSRRPSATPRPDGAPRTPRPST
jgi:DNA-binding MarR family transcriptional regulator